MRVAEERAYWDKAAQDPDVAVKYIADVPTSECLDLIITELEKHVQLEGSRIMDIGCGIGRLTIPMAQQYPTSAVVGVDISERMLELARKAAPERGPLFIKNNGRRLPDIKTDAAYCMLLFQHLDAEGFENYIQEAARVLRTGGVFCFQFIAGTEQEPFSRHYSIAQVDEWLGKTGFIIKRQVIGPIHEQWTWITAVRS